MSPLGLAKRELITIVPSKKLKRNRWHNTVPYDQAVTMVTQGAAYIRTPYTIEKIFDSKSFNKFILERDNHICRYCGKYGDTVDHVLPKASGGLSTPKNCVCACYNCNQSKGHLLLEEWLAGNEMNLSS